MTLPSRIAFLLLFTFCSASADTVTHTNDGPFSEVPSLLRKAGITLVPGVETAQSSFFVPGQKGQQITLTFTYLTEFSGLQAEFGYFPMSAVEGMDPDTWQEPAMAAKTIVFEVWKDAPGTEKTITIESGTELGFYIIPNEGGGNVPRQAVDLVPLFSEPNANPGDFDQFLSFIGTGTTLFTWEDLRRDGLASLGASDEDFGDVAFTIDAELAPEAPLGYGEFLEQEGLEDVGILRNPSFEIPGDGKHEDQWILVPGWDLRQGTGCGVDEFVDASEGNYAAYLSAGCEIGQFDAKPLEAGYYALTFDARSPDGEGTISVSIGRKTSAFSQIVVLEHFEAATGEPFETYSIVLLVLPHQEEGTGIFDLAFKNPGSEGSPTVQLDNIRFQRANRTKFSGPAPPTDIVPESLSFSEVQLTWNPSPDPERFAIAVEREDKPRFGNAVWTRIAELRGDATSWIDLGVNHEGPVRYRVGASDQARFDWNYSPVFEVTLPEVALPTYEWEVVEDRSLAQADIEDIAYGNELYVAVGRQGTDGYVETSVDGQTWAPVPHENVPAGALKRIIFDGNRFVAIDQVGRQGLSTDGRTWSFGEIAHAVGNSTSLASRAGVAVAVANGIYVSTSGEPWESVRIEGVFQVASAVVFNDQFVLVTPTGAIYTSVDGFEWTIAREDQGANNHSERTLFVLDGKIWESTQSGLANSADLMIWTPLIIPVGTQVLQNVFVVGDLRIFASRNARVITSMDGVTFDGPTSIEGVPLSNATGATGPAGLLALDQNRVMHRTVDGRTWEIVRPRSESYHKLGGFAADETANTLVAAVGTKIFRRNLNAADNSWEEVWNTGFNAPPFSHIDHIAGQFVAVGQSGLIATSTDGTVWEERHRSNPGQALHLVAELDGKIITTGQGLMLQSEDGMQTWETVDFNGGFQPTPFLETGAGLITTVRPDALGVPMFALSSDGETWETAASFPVENVSTSTGAFGAFNGRSRFVARGGGVYVSSDGQSWSVSPNPLPLGRQALFYDDDDGNWVRVVLGNTNANTLAASPNGLHFVEHESDVIDASHVQGATLTANRYFLFGTAGQPFYVATLKRTGNGPGPEDAYTSWVKSETGQEIVDDPKYARGGDLDADGLLNYTEFLLGLRLLAPDPGGLDGILKVYIGGPTNNLTAEIPIRAGIEPLPTAEICDDLSFDEACDTSQGVAVGEPVNGFVTVRFRDVVPADSSDHRYLRIKFQLP